MITSLIHNCLQVIEGDGVSVLSASGQSVIRVLGLRVIGYRA